MFESDVKDLGVGFADADFAGDDNTVEVWFKVDGFDFAPLEIGYAVGDESEFILLG